MITIDQLLEIVIYVGKKVKLIHDTARKIRKAK